MDQYLEHPVPFRYAFSFHFVPEHRDFLVDYLQERFPDKRLIVQEISDQGNVHIQGYGETSMQFTDAERTKFRGRGMYAKCLRKMKTKNNYSIAFARLTAELNYNYILKEFCHMAEKSRDDILSYDPTIDLDLAIDNSKKYNAELPVVKKPKKLLSFEDRVIQWYEAIPTDERPRTPSDIFYRMYWDKVVPMTQWTPQAYRRAIDCILGRYHVSWGEKNGFIEEFKDRVFRE